MQTRFRERFMEQQIASGLDGGASFFYGSLPETGGIPFWHAGLDVFLLRLDFFFICSKGLLDPFLFQKYFTSMLWTSMNTIGHYRSKEILDSCSFTQKWPQEVTDSQRFCCSVCVLHVFWRAHASVVQLSPLVQRHMEVMISTKWIVWFAIFPSPPTPWDQFQKHWKLYNSSY